MAAVLQAGDTVAGYTVDGVLGRGGMGVVYLATHRRLRRQVALKVLSPQLGDDEGFRERFIRESQLAAALDHPNVIPIYDAGEQDGNGFGVLTQAPADQWASWSGRFDSIRRSLTIP